MRFRSVKYAEKMRPNINCGSTLITFSDLRWLVPAKWRGGVYRLPLHVADAVELWNASLFSVTPTPLQVSRNNNGKTTCPAYAPMTKREYIEEVVKGAYVIDCEDAERERADRKERKKKRREQRRAWFAAKTLIEGSAA